MTKIIWSKRASNDNRRIVNYLSDYDLKLAKIFVRTFEKSLENLKVFPKMGRMVLERDDPEIKEIILKKYWIIYTIFETDIMILTIFHSSRLFKL